MMRFIDCSVKSVQLEMLMKVTLFRKAFFKPKSVIPVQPETFNTRSVLQILETSKIFAGSLSHNRRIFRNPVPLFANKRDGSSNEMKRNKTKNA